jgi:hypothetical protein
MHNASQWGRQGPTSVVDRSSACRRHDFHCLKLDACSSVLEVFKQCMDYREPAKHMTSCPEIRGRKKDNRT